MDTSFFLGIVVGLLLAYIFVRFTKSRAPKTDEVRPEYIDLKKKWYFDDKTKVYITILAVILILLFVAYTMHDEPQVYNRH